MSPILTKCLTSWCFVDKETDYSEGLFDTSVNTDITQLLLARLLPNVIANVNVT